MDKKKLAFDKTNFILLAVGMAIIILGFILINIFYKKRKYDGQIFFAVCGWYGLGRAWIEGLRTDSLYLPEIFGLTLRVSQVLALAIAALCIGILIYHAVKKTNKPLYIKA